MGIQHLERPLAIKSLGADGVFAGYASVFGAVDHQNEVVAAGAFTKTWGAGRGQGRASPARRLRQRPRHRAR